MSTISTTGTAADLMQRDVIVVYRDDTLQQAMSLITENHITGMPVVDSRSKCIGVITAADILNYEQEHVEYASEVNDNMALHFDPDNGRWEHVRASSYALEHFGEVRVNEVMSTDLLSVSPDTPLKEIAEKMCQDKIHRVLVLDPEGRLLGIISSSDFVTLFAKLE